MNTCLRFRTKLFWIVVFVVCCIGAPHLWRVDEVHAATYTVTTTADSGAGSLRQAILDANAHAGTDTIEFHIPGTGVHTIQLSSELTAITSPAVIDGTTQPGWSVGSLKIELDGSSIAGYAAGLRISAGDSVVRGLSIMEFAFAGIFVLTNGGNVIEGNYIGTNASGTAALGNGYGIYISSSNNRVGGTTAGARNLISGNTGTGVHITGSNNTVQGNYIGTNASGTAALGNGYYGVTLDGAADSYIGGDTAGAGNVLSGNVLYGVLISGSSATGNTVLGNYIGTNASGTSALGNGSHGVVIDSAPGNTIGGATAGARNLISGNQSYGVHITNGVANRVLGNYIGTDVTGMLALPNSYGVVIQEAPNNVIGGETAGARNVLSGNEFHGVLISGSSASGNRVIGNYIGTDLTGTAALGNGSNGVGIDNAPYNYIGYITAGARNIISGNQDLGIYIYGSSATGNQVLGNYIGTDVTGMVALPNDYGVVLQEAPNNTVGGNPAWRNVISGNHQYGVYLYSSANNNQVLGNFIGTDAAGTAALGNGSAGVRIHLASDNIIGGYNSKNRIAFNGADGVMVSEGTENRIQYNIINANAGLGINLGYDGVTANDPGDGDSGPNNLQNFPEIIAVDAASFTVTATLNSTPNAYFRVHFYTNTECDSSGYGEGETFQSYVGGTTDIAGNATFYATLEEVTEDGFYLTATTIDADGNTSEFSQCFWVPPLNELSAPKLRAPRDRTNTADTTPKFTWASVRGAAHYHLQVDNDPDFFSPLIDNDTLTRSNYTVPAGSELAYGTYYWRVQAGDAAGLWSTWSAIRGVTVTILKSPRNGDFTTDTTPVLQWFNAGSLVQYQLQVDTSPEFSSIPLPVDQITADTRYEPGSALAYGRTYWRMRVDTGGGFGDWTPVWTFTITLDPPGKPELLSPADKSPLNTTTPLFTWGEAEGGHIYQIQIDDQRSFSSPVQDATLAEGLRTYTASEMAYGGQYYWRVRALNGVGVAGAWSKPWSFTLTRLPAPLLNSPPNKMVTADTAPTFTWSAVTGAAGYVIQISTDARFQFVIRSQDPDETTYTPSPMPEGVYYWRVCAINATRLFGQWSKVRTFTVDLTGPAAPQLVNPADYAGTTDTTPKLTWKRVTGAQGYQLQLSDDPTFATTPITAVSGTSYTVPDAKALSYDRYYWRVQAQDAQDNWGDWSPSHTFTVTILKTPKDASTTTDTTPTFAWNGLSGVGQYQLQVDTTDASFTHLLINQGVAATRWTVPTGQALPHDTYFWRVSADGGTTWMPAWTVTITPGLPGKPKLLTPTNKTLTNDDTPWFSWEAVTNGHVYQIQIDDDQGFNSPDQDVVLSVGERTYPATQLGEGKWYWRVRAFNSVGAPGPWSARWSLTVDITPPTYPIPIAPADEARVTNPKLTLEWTASEGADRYEVQLDPNSGFPLPPIDVGKKTKYTPPTSLAQATYYWRVRAVDKAGNVSLWTSTREVHLVAGNTIVTTPTGEPILIPAQEPVVEPPPSTPGDEPATPEPPVIVPLPPDEPSDPAAPPDQPNQPPARE